MIGRTLVSRERERRKGLVLAGPTGPAKVVEDQNKSIRSAIAALWVMAFGLLALISVQTVLVWAGANEADKTSNASFVTIFYSLAGLAILLCSLVALNLFIGRKRKKQFQAFEMLVAAIGHDFGTPLNTIRSALSALYEGVDLDERKQSFLTATNAAHSLGRLVTDIARITKGDPLPVEAEDVNVEAWFRDLVERYKDKVHAKGLGFTVNIAPHPMTLHLDPHRLTQCVGNLLDNAIRYTQDGRIDLSLQVRSHARGSGEEKALIIKVKDTGIGIAKHDLERIFHPFQRAKNSQNNHGLGLGLAIVQAMAKSSKGGISVVSEIGKGSVFTFIIPVREVAVISQPWENEVLHDEVFAPEIGGILVVSADTQVSACAAKILNDAGFSVDTKTNVFDATSWASIHNPRVVLADFCSLGPSGFDLAVEYKKLKSSPFFIAVTDDPIELRNDKRANFLNGILVKPFDEEALLSSVEAADDYKSAPN